MRVRVRFLGSLRAASGVKEVRVELGGGSDVATLARLLSDEHPELADMLSNPTIGNLIIIGGVEISNLQGLETTLSEGSEVVFVPVTHGG